MDTDAARIVKALHDNALALRDADLTRLADSEFRTMWLLFEKVCLILTGFVANRMITEVAARNLPMVTGFRALVRYLKHQLRLSGSQAHRRVRDAADLAERTSPIGDPLPARHPHITAAQYEGAITLEHAHTILDALARIPRRVEADERDKAEHVLTTLATQSGPEQLRIAATRVLAYLDPDGSITDDLDRARRRSLHVSRQDFDLMTRITGELDPQTRALFDVILTKWAAPGANNFEDPHSPRGSLDHPDTDATLLEAAAGRDHRTQAQRNHDALKALLLHTLNTPHHNPADPANPGDSSDPNDSDRHATTNGKRRTSGDCRKPGNADCHAKTEESDAHANFGRHGKPNDSSGDADADRGKPDDSRGHAHTDGGMPDDGSRSHANIDGGKPDDDFCSHADADGREPGGYGSHGESNGGASGDSGDRSNSRGGNSAGRGSSGDRSESGGRGRSGGLGEHNGLPMHLVVTMSLRDLEDETGLATTATGTVLPVADALAIAARKRPYLLLFDHNDRPLHFFHQRRTANLDQRLVLFATERGCTRPGCLVPATGCQTHHRRYDHQHGSSTGIHDLALVCPHDHRQLDANDGINTPTGWHTRPGDPNGPHPGRTQWIPPTVIDPDRQPQVNNTHHPDRLLAQAEAHLHNPPQSPTTPTPRTHPAQTNAAHADATHTHTTQTDATQVDLVHTLRADERRAG